MDLIRLVGRPIPENAQARDILLAALLGSGPRPVSEDQNRLLAAVPGLLADGLIEETEDGIALVHGAADAASAARDRMARAREARADWGRELQAALRARRLRLAEQSATA